VRSGSTGFRAWLWKTIDGFSEGKAEKAEAAGDEIDGEDLDGPMDMEGAHVRVEK
jgi:hypothetical protein